MLPLLQVHGRTVDAVTFSVFEIIAGAELVMLFSTWLLLGIVQVLRTLPMLAIPCVDDTGDVGIL